MLTLDLLRESNISNTHFLYEYLSKYGVDKYNLREDIILTSFIAEILKMNKKTNMEINLYASAAYIFQSNKKMKICRCRDCDYEPDTTKPKILSFRLNNAPNKIPLDTEITSPFIFSFSIKDIQYAKPNSLKITDVTNAKILGENLSLYSPVSIDTESLKLSTPGTVLWEMSILDLENNIYTATYSVTWYEAVKVSKVYVLNTHEYPKEEDIDNGEVFEILSEQLNDVTVVPNQRVFTLVFPKHIELVSATSAIGEPIYNTSTGNDAFDTKSSLVKDGIEYNMWSLGMAIPFNMEVKNIFKYKE